MKFFFGSEAPISIYENILEIYNRADITRRIVKRIM